MSDEFTTYKRADGELIDDFGFVTDLDGYEFEEPTELIEEVWTLKTRRTFILPTCSMCDDPATHWGLCEKHFREDDPDAFDSAP